MSSKGYTIFVALLLAGLSLTSKANVLSDSTNRNPGLKDTDKPDANARYFSGLTTSFHEHADPIIIPAEAADDSVEYYRNKALEYQAEVNRNNATIETLNSLAYATLPVGIQRTIGGLTYTVIISKLEATPAGSFIEAYCMLELPQTGDKIAFRGKKIPFSNSGGFSGIGRLELIGNYHIKLTDKILFTLEGRGNTFVEFDCDGFKGIGLEAGIEFSRDLLVPEEVDGSVKPTPERVDRVRDFKASLWRELFCSRSTM